MTREQIHERVMKSEFEFTRYTETEEFAIEISNAQLDEIKKHIGWHSFDNDGNACVIEVQKLQQYLTSLKIV